MKNWIKKQLLTIFAFCVDLKFEGGGQNKRGTGARGRSEGETKLKCNELG